MVEYELTDKGYYVITHQSQEVGTTVPVGRSIMRTKNADGTYTIKSITGLKTFVDDSNYLQLIELVDNSGDTTPNINCRNAVCNVTIYEDYAYLQHPERQWVSIEQEKWYIYLFDGVDTWNRLTPDSTSISYETITDGYILKRILTHGDSTFTISYKLLEGNFVEQGIRIDNGSPSDQQIRFALTMDIPAPTFSVGEGDEITPTETEVENDVNTDIDNFRVKVGNVMRARVDISRIKQHILKWTYKKIDVDKIRIGVITKGFTVTTGNYLEYWF